MKIKVSSEPATVKLPTKRMSLATHIVFIAVMLALSNNLFLRIATSRLPHQLLEPALAEPTK